MSTCLVALTIGFCYNLCERQVDQKLLATTLSMNDINYYCIGDAAGGTSIATTVSTGIASYAFPYISNLTYHWQIPSLLLWVWR